ncbi:MAG: beta-phosphoglucomutase [Chitinophagaceae bacterium]|nr:beta-phosphoglucomutase [Anaerolineae bacterium]
MDIKAFIFDLDGVITDTAELHYQAWTQLAQQEGLTFSREINERLRGVTRRVSLQIMLDESGRTIDEATAEVWMTRKNEAYRAMLHDLTPADALPGVPEFLREARAAGIKIGLGSASRNARDVLTSLQLIDAFDAIGDGNSVVNSKPAPDLFVWVAGALGISPAAGLVFEDAEAGVEAALAGGFRVVGIGSANVDKAHFVVPGIKALTVAEVISRLSK